MLAWVYDATLGAGLNDVIIATDSDEIQALGRREGWHVEMTSAEHRSGTERVHEVAQRVAADVYINLQGDEPLARAEQLSALVALMRSAAVEVGTLATSAQRDDIPNPNVVKVVTDAAGRALYFSRATIPYDRDGAAPRYLKHLGFYAYRKPALERFVTLPESRLERAERLEQLRFLENGIAIHVAETPHDSIGVDTEDDLRRVDALLRAR